MKVLQTDNFGNQKEVEIKPVAESNKQKKGKIIITAEIEDFPENGKFLDFSFVIMEDGWLTKIFKNWKKITIKRAMITNLEIKK